MSALPKIIDMNGLCRLPALVSKYLRLRHIVHEVYLCRI
jgi:hypothetical protein